MPKLRDPKGYSEKVPPEVPGGQQKRWIGKTRAAASLCFNFFSPNEHSKATKPRQKHTFHLHSDLTPQLCTCCSHLHSKGKLTSARKTS